jgi:hypothetical protein
MISTTTNTSISVKPVLSFAEGPVLSRVEGPVPVFAGKLVPNLRPALSVTDGRVAEFMEL